MAVTHGHGNPDWTRDEVILALNLYFDCGGSMPSASDPRVVALSEALQGLPIHPVDARKGSFRNPDGVAFKLQNLRKVASGKGLGNVSRVDREVWESFGSRPKEIAALAAEIRTSVAWNAPEHDEVEDEFPEGRLLTARHHRRERCPAVRRLLLASRQKKGPLVCDGCAWTPTTADPTLHTAGFEAHHLRPLALTGETATKVSEMALLCATCHRIVHRWISRKGEWLTRERIVAVIAAKPGPSLK